MRYILQHLFALGTHIETQRAGTNGMIVGGTIASRQTYQTQHGKVFKKKKLKCSNVYVFAAGCRRWLRRRCTVVLAFITSKGWFGGGGVVVGKEGEL